MLENNLTKLGHQLTCEAKDLKHDVLTDIFALKNEVSKDIHDGIESMQSTLQEEALADKALVGEERALAKAGAH